VTQCTEDQFRSTNIDSEVLAIVATSETEVYNF